ncbi:hypothetical protein [Sphingobacterium chuzhouense]|uniref:Transposase n=1 Tax=Sphingobacterium chuzhouense TaxID=1742264 RepID=A0ABR7XTS4_9SPHI|nr:hypothetical protein [Sphingobacterium chuzhouense]MBD1422588.1 hypothetical protein [Sphingobacterium chuzhouense]
MNTATSNTLNNGKSKRTKPQAGAIPIVSISKRNKKHHLQQSIINIIENATGQSLSVTRNEMSERDLFFLGLQYIITTKKTYCFALDIPIEAGCRYKRFFERSGKLVQSIDKVRCPVTKHWASLITTNPRNFDCLRKSYNRQLTLF